MSATDYREMSSTRMPPFKDKQGIIWFGGMNGITYFNPQDIINPAKTWNIRITDFFPA